MSGQQKNNQVEEELESILDEQQEETSKQPGLAEQLAAAQQKADEHWDALLRTQAEMENLRRRTRIDVENAHKYGLEKILNALIPVADSMELGLEAASKEGASVESINEGLEMTFKQLLDVLADFNIERIDPKGEKFDPQKHEAMSMVPSPEHEANTVMEVFQKGYALNERLIRPARVIVSKEA